MKNLLKKNLDHVHTNNLSDMPIPTHTHTCTPTLRRTREVLVKTRVNGLDRLEYCSHCINLCYLFYLNTKLYLKKKSRKRENSEITKASDYIHSDG